MSSYWTGKKASSISPAASMARRGSSTQAEIRHCTSRSTFASGSSWGRPRPTYTTRPRGVTAQPANSIRSSGGGKSSLGDTMPRPGSPSSRSRSRSIQSLSRTSTSLSIQAAYSPSASRMPWLRPAGAPAFVSLRWHFMPTSCSVSRRCQAGISSKLPSVEPLSTSTTSSGRCVDRTTDSRHLRV